MKNKVKILIGLLVLLLSAVTYGQSQWEIRQDYSITFSGTGAEGSFRGLEGSIQFDPDNLDQSQFNVSINPATISTGNKTKNKHARGDSWFDVEKYTKVGFVSEEIKKTDGGYVAEGMLTMHGVSNKDQINFTFSRQQSNMGLFEGIMKVNREDYGIEGPLISFMVGDEFEVRISLPVKKE
ncbi:MAG: YceI family protein [Reichenbachiella sp.]|uniref:YceI family protein n=1 Tax=Reichenbachiella sp. TaxID=2184521 RepID=UPI002965E4BC|nr:YceI family protein [Reichenbachiella sp.]MDW3209653.1 YceI family protein [Reichenbachiella sp.]